MIGEGNQPSKPQARMMIGGGSAGLSKDLHFELRFISNSAPQQADPYKVQ